MLEHTVTFTGTLVMTIKLLVALSLGCLIGVERQWRQRYTGVTTYALVALGAAAYTSLPSLYGTVDLRLSGQVVTGIGFLGAGLIMREGQSVRGLGTAATVWSTGAVGMLIGNGMWIEGIEAAVLISVANVFLPRLNGFFERFAPAQQHADRFYKVQLGCADQEEASIRSRLLQAITARKLRLQSVESHRVADTSHVMVEAVLYSTDSKDALVEGLVADLIISPLVFSSRWTRMDPPD